MTALLTNSQTKPDYMNVDLQGHYDIHFNPLTLAIVLRIYNVLDIRNQINVYDDTGLAGVTIDETNGLATNPPQRINTLDQYYHTPTQYSEPRRIEFGMNLEF